MTADLLEADLSMVDVVINEESQIRVPDSGFTKCA
jgi:hypothetical protein